MMKGYNRWKILVLLFFSALMMVAGGNAFATTITVTSPGTIQAAVDAAVDGDTVSVNPGTYVESVMVNKSIKLIAPSGATIQCPASPSYAYVDPSTAKFFYTVGLFGGTYDAGAHTVSGTGTITVEMSGFTIDANSYPVVHPAEYVSILSRNVNKAYADRVASIHNNNLINISFATSGQTIGIVGYGTMDITVDSNTITKFNRCGIEIATGAAVITNNTVRGASDELTQHWASNGIETGANGLVQGNDISYCGWPGASNWAGTGLIVFDPATSVLVTKNNIHNCTDVKHHGQAVYIMGSPGSLSNVSFTNNIIENCDGGLVIDEDVNGVTIAYNHFNGISHGDSIDVQWVSVEPRGIKINYNYFGQNAYDGLVVWNGYYGTDLKQTHTIDATNNWWGMDVGPGDIFINGVDTLINPLDLNGFATYSDPALTLYSPWLVKPFNGYKYLMADYGSAGLWIFDGVSGGTRATTSNVGAMAYYFDGTNERVCAADSTGLWSYLSTIPHTPAHIGGAVPDNLMAFKSVLLIDYGKKYGLYKYDGSSFTQLGSADPGIMCNVGPYALIDYPGYGLYKFDGANFTLIGSAHPENIIKFGSGALVDYGTAYGLYLYNGSGFTNINAHDPGLMVSIGSYALIDFPGYGLYKYEGGSLTIIGSVHPENIVALSDTVALIDYGTAYGLYKYDGSNFIKIGSADVAKMVQVNSQVYLDYAVYGLYKYDGTTFTSISKPPSVATVAEQMLDAGMN